MIRHLVPEPEEIRLSQGRIILCEILSALTWGSSEGQVLLACCISITELVLKYLAVGVQISVR
jgi:hypothetical protein